MTEFHPALSVSVEEDLLPLSAILHQRGVVHRIFEENGKQVLMVQHAAQAPTSSHFIVPGAPARYASSWRARAGARRLLAWWPGGACR